MNSHTLKYIVVFGLSVLVGTAARALTVNVAVNGDIQGAINEVAAAGGGTVNVGSGTATLQTELVMANSVTLNGAGNPATTWDLASGAAGGVKSPSSAWSNIALTNFKIYGAGTSVAQEGCNIGGVGSSNNGGKMSNIQVLNTGYGAGLMACNNGSVSSCNFHNSGMSNLYHGFYFGGGSATVISGNQMNNSPMGSGLHVNNWATINSGSDNNNTTSNNGQNGHSFTASTSDPFTNWTINSCTANSNGYAYTTGSEYGFYLGAGSGTIENCTASGNRTANYYTGAFKQINNH
ncbi:MAG TPA: hypothetical protein VMV72_10820 [Verrucomicrobiae bacterium]|nr:hypothetical protein [Verrucomicrobiae bacterium]